MKNVLWGLAALGIVMFILGVVMRFVHTDWLFSAQGYWRGAMAFWMLTVTLKLLCDEKK